MAEARTDNTTFLSGRAAFAAVFEQTEQLRLVAGNLASATELLNDTYWKGELALYGVPHGETRSRRIRPKELVELIITLRLLPGEYDPDSGALVKTSSHIPEIRRRHRALMIGEPPAVDHAYSDIEEVRNWWMRQWSKLVPIEWIDKATDALMHEPPAALPPTSKVTESDVAALVQIDEDALTPGERAVNAALKVLEGAQGAAFYNLRAPRRLKLVEQQMKEVDSSATVSPALLRKVEAMRPIKRRMKNKRRKHLSK